MGGAAAFTQFLNQPDAARPSHAFLFDKAHQLKTIACHARIDRAIVLLLLALSKPNLRGPKT
jgi:hypothetical protein